MVREKMCIYKRSEGSKRVMMSREIKKEEDDENIGGKKK